MTHLNPARSLAIALVAVLVVSLTSAAQAQTGLKILFIGNSFTNGGPIPTLVRDLATSAGYPTPTCTNAAVNSMTLEWHTTNAPTLAYVDQGGWDYVVLQEYSTRPTDSPSAANADPARFEQDVTWFYDRIKLTSPNAKIVLYETWARHENNTMYPGVFASRDVMQEQLNYWYHHAAFTYIPEHSTSAVKTDVILAPCGEVWHADYHGLNYNLHGGDLYHAGDLGAHVNALTIFGAIYKTQVYNLPGGGAAMENYLRQLVDQTNALYANGGGGNYNYRPGVFAGADNSIMLPTNQVTLAGMVTDDGLPNPPAAVTVTWSQASGPATATFADVHALNSRVTLPVEGIYILRLTASDGELSATDDVAITVNPSGTIAILNPSFEANVIADGSYNNRVADNWAQDAGGTNAWGTKNPGVSEMPNSGGTSPLAAPGDGPQYLYMNSGQTSQALSTTLQANMTYNLKVAVARRLETTREDANYYIRLYAGTTLLGEFTGNTTAITGGTLVDRIVTYTSAANDPKVGQALKIVLGTPDPHASRRLAFDNVRLYAQPVFVPLLGDFNGDRKVDIADYTVWADHFNQSDAAFAQGSSNGDGTIDIADYTTWADHFGQAAMTVGQSDAPEVVAAPATIVKAKSSSLAAFKRSERAQARLEVRQHRATLRTRR